MMKFPFFFLSIFLLPCPACSPETDTTLIGVKIYEHSAPYDQLFDQWKQMGINTAFSSETLISDKDFMKEAREHQISTFVIFPVFFNPEAIVEDAGLAAINRTGEAGWRSWSMHGKSSANTSPMGSVSILSVILYTGKKFTLTRTLRHFLSPVLTPCV